MTFLERKSANLSNEKKRTGLLPRQWPILGLLTASLMALDTNLACSQGTTQLRGVRHQVNLSIKFDPASRPLQDEPKEPVKATLTVAVAISDQAQGSSFFGTVLGTISDFDPVKGSTDQKIWSDAKCHPERGLPKITALSADGSIIEGSKDISILSRFRRLGLLVPSDEVTPGRGLPGGVDEIGPFIATRAETKKSHLFLVLKLYTLPCDLETR